MGSLYHIRSVSTWSLLRAHDARSETEVMSSFSRSVHPPGVHDFSRSVHPPASGLSVGHSCAYMRAEEVSPNDVISKVSVHPPVPPEDCTCTTEETASLGLSPYFF
jgi:hypothetical protein